MAGAGSLHVFFSQRPLNVTAVKVWGFEHGRCFLMDEIREHGLPLPIFLGRTLFIYYTMISFSPIDSFLLKLFEFNLPDLRAALRFERVGGVLQRSWILGIENSSHPVFLFHRHFCFGVSGVFLNSRDSPIATISQLSWLINQSSPNPPPS